MSDPTTKEIAIIGGGIAGLFCALILQQQGKSFSLFETSARLGGRIRTLRLDKENKPLTEKDWGGNLEFYAEFGPMRVELERQLLLKALLQHLEIKPLPAGASTGKEACLVDFPAYASPTSSHDPKYELLPEEEGKTPLELLRMALLRIMVNVETDAGCEFEEKKNELIKRISVTAAVRQSVDKVFCEWMKKDLKDQHYWEIQTKGRIEDVPLYAMGFWNLLSDYLSHNAITKLRDLGTFYHLLPENPNAAEWLVWWLIGFSISEKLQGIFGGMECIVDKLTARLKSDPNNPFDCHDNSWVKRIEKTKSGELKLNFDKKKRPKDSEVANRTYKHVILALPKKALQQVYSQSLEAFAQEKEMKGLLDSAFGFPMVKMFVVVKERWWEEEHRANRFATRVPTRELHYWKGRTQGSKQGLIMAYTDRPASAFWSNYVPSGAQIDVNRTGDRKFELDPSLQARLKKKVVQYINENNLPDITDDDIVWYGIRDWGREPYGGANHAWRPERKYWVVMRRLADIPLRAETAGNSGLHICGEAYSDYHGFMEGSLRSAVYVLHRILDRKPDLDKHDNLSWLLTEESDLCKDSKLSRLCVDDAYLESLRDWASNLDDDENTGSYLIEESD